MVAIDMEMPVLVEQFAAARRQEEGVYRCLDYMALDFQVRQEKNGPPQDASNNIFSAFLSSFSSSSSVSISEAERQRICEWNFNVIDHFDFNREIASISLNYLDRYLNLNIGMIKGKTFQLVAMTSLFIAIKIYEPKVVRMSSFIELGRGYFTIDHMTKMEYSILWTLSWHVHPPTPLSFVRNFITLLQETGCSSTIVLEIKQIAQFITELSVCDYYFTTHKSSSVGLGALLTAFDAFSEASLSLHIRHAFLVLVQSVAGLEPSSEEVLDCKDRLCEAYFEETKQQEIELFGIFTDVGRLSPDCVAEEQESDLFKTKR